MKALAALIALPVIVILNIIVGLFFFLVNILTYFFTLGVVVSGQHLQKAQADIEAKVENNNQVKLDTLVAQWSRDDTLSEDITEIIPAEVAEIMADHNVAQWEAERILSDQTYYN